MSYARAAKETKSIMPGCLEWIPLTAKRRTLHRGEGEEENQGRVR